MSPEDQRRWTWFQQTVDMVVATLGIATGATMLIRDSWPVGGILFALVCLGKIGATAAVNALTERWSK